jgi:hypothetical protein
MTSPQPIPLEELYDNTHRRLLHGGDQWTGQPYGLFDDDGIELAAGNGQRPNCGIGITPDYGTQITGPMSFSEMPQNISFGGGYWRLNPLLLTCMGSSPLPDSRLRHAADYGWRGDISERTCLGPCWDIAGPRKFHLRDVDRFRPQT